MELVLGISILNKAGGAFGVLSLLTGHPLNFWQWLYNMSCLLILPFYISGLSHLTDRIKNVRKMSFVCLLYTFDTVFGLLYTFYFTYFWFSHEDTNPTGNDIRNYHEESDVGTGFGASTGSSGSMGDSTIDLSQSASPARELFLTVSATLITTVVRFYFNLIIISFSRLLIKQCSDMNDSNIITEEEQLYYQSKSLTTKVKKLFFELEIKSEEYLADFFNKS